MSQIYIAKDKLASVVESLRGSQRVYGPVSNGQFHEWALLESAKDLDLGYTNTKFSPKGLFHPQAERMFAYSLDKNNPKCGILEEVEKDYSPRLILGIRPCDAKAFSLDDKNFDTSTYKDPWWVRRRQSSTLVGLACNSGLSTCFCTSTGTGPFDTTGLDALMVDVGEGYVLSALTDKGKALLKAIKADKPSKEALDKVDAQKKQAEESIARIFDTKPIADKDLLELFNDALWEEVQFGCLNCGTCTFMCPTCWCFDIQDEVQGDKGDRLRLWDSCMFPLFTHHGSGHNPRSVKTQRVRQRFMHKLKYYQDKYECGVACVGCGRCVRACPVNVDIRQVARKMTASCSCPA